MQSETQSWIKAYEKTSILTISTVYDCFVEWMTAILK